MWPKVHGPQVQLAYNGPEALRAAERFLPQVIILDIGLPGMNGYEVAKRLRQQPEFKSAMLVAVAGYGQEEDRRRPPGAGVNFPLAQPGEPADPRRVVGPLPRPGAVPTLRAAFSS